MQIPGAARRDAHPRISKAGLDAAHDRPEETADSHRHITKPCYYADARAWALKPLGPRPLGVIFINT